MSDNRGDLEIPETGLIQSGPETEPDQQDRALSAREATLARIYAHREEIQAREIEAAETEVEHLPQNELEQPGDHAEAPQQRQAPSRRQQHSGQEVHVVNVDGNELSVTTEQMHQLAAMGAIAHRELNRYQAQQAQGWQQPPQYQPQQAPAPQPQVDRERIRDVVKRIQYGTEDDAADAFAGFVGDLVSRQPNAERVVQQHLQHAAMQHKLQQDTAVISAEYPDIINDKIRARAAAQEVEVLRNWAASTGQQFDDLAIYREAGNRVRASFGSAPEQGGQSYQNGNVVVRRSPDRLEAKRNLPRPVSGIDRRSPGPAQQRAPSPSDIVAQMKRNRGQGF